MVEAWSEVLAPVVPSERLNDCYLYAMQHRDSTFPLAATEVLTAWRIINAEESHQRLKNKPCDLCDGSGYRMVRDPDNHDRDILKECPHCHGKVVTSLERVG